VLEVARAIREHRHTGSSQALLEFGAKEGDYEAIEGVPGDCEYVYGLRIVCGEAIILFASSRELMTGWKESSDPVIEFIEAYRLPAGSEPSRGCGTFLLLNDHFFRGTPKTFRGRSNTPKTFLTPYKH